MTYNKKVIQLVVPGVWRFFDFRAPNGANPIADWYKNDLSDDAKYAFVDTLKDIEKIESPNNWLCFKRFLAGKYRKYRIWELWFACGDKRQYRILGIFGPNRKQATLLVGCFHKGSVYTPPDSLDLSYTRARALSEGTAGRYERKIPTSR